MKNQWLWSLLSWLVLLVVAGCSQVTIIDSSEIVSPSPEIIPKDETGTPSPSAPPLPPTQVPKEEIVIEGSFPNAYDPALESLVKQARQDLAQRLDIDQDDILVIEAKAVVWSDPSMGCPQPGMVYIQVPQDGTLIILKVVDREYEYHSGGDQAPFLCEKPLKTKKSTPNTDKIIPPPMRSVDE